MSIPKNSSNCKLSVQLLKMVSGIALILLVLTILAIGGLFYTMSRMHVEGFTDPSGNEVAIVTDSCGASVPLVLPTLLPTNKTQLLAQVLDILRNEINRLNGLNRTDIVVITRTQNLTRLRDALQQMYVDLMEGRIQESDIEFGPDEVAAFLPSIGPQADMSSELPSLMNSQLDTLKTTLGALRDANIYWSLELGVQNFNPQPAPVAARPGLSDRSRYNNSENTDASRGRNARSVDGSLNDETQPESTDRSWTNFTSSGRMDTQAEIDPLDYKQRIKSTCDAIRRGQLGDPVRDFGCFDKGAEKTIGPTFDYKGRYYMICDRLGLTWGSGYQQMLGCPVQFTN